MYNLAFEMTAEKRGSLSTLRLDFRMTDNNSSLPETHDAHAKVHLGKNPR